MSSKQVTDREKSATLVVAVAETQAAAVAEALTPLLTAHLKPGEALPDMALFMTLGARVLDAAKVRMVTADIAHDAELGDDEPIRRQRNDAQVALSDKLVELREVITGLYGPAAATRVFAGPTPADPVVLARFAGDVAATLSTVTLPAPRIAGAKIDPAATVAEIVALKTALDTSLKDVAREVREAQVTLDAKTHAMADYEASFAGWATAFSGLLRAAGKPELAAKVRPSARRPGQTAEAPEEEPAEPKTPEK